MAASSFEGVQPVLQQGEGWAQLYPQPASRVTPLDAASATGALLVAVPLGPLVTLATLTVARSRVHSAAADKVLALPVYLPIAAWWLTGPAGRLLAPLPTYWIVRSWPDPHQIYLLGGLACLAAWLIPLTRRVTRRLW